MFKAVAVSKAVASFVSKKSLSSVTVVAMLLSFFGFGALPAQAIEATAYQTISGTVSTADGLPFAEDEVAAYLHLSDGSNPSVAMVDPTTGYYEFTNVPTDDGTDPIQYTVRFGPSSLSRFAPIWIDGSYSFDDVSTWITLISSTEGVLNADAHDVTDANVVLELGTSISGTVTTGEGATWESRSSEKPTVRAFRSDNGQLVLQSEKLVADDGTYSLNQLPVATYYLEIVAATGSTWITEWYDNAPNADQATALNPTVEVPLVAHNVVLEAGATISGTVSYLSSAAATPAARSGVTVRVLSTDGSFEYTTALTDQAGGYSVSGLATGEYILSFDDGTPLYLTGAGGLSWSVDAAEVISITAGDSVSRNATIRALNTISGTVLDSFGDPLAGERVIAYIIGDNSYDGIASAQTDETGAYTITNVPAGSYIVTHACSSDPCTWMGAVYNVNGTVESFEEGTPIDVDIADEVTSVDLVLSERTTGEVNGKILDTSNNPVDGLSLELIDSNTGEAVAWGATNAEGNFTVWDAPAGTGYLLKVVDYAEVRRVADQYFTADGQKGSSLANAGTLDIEAKTSTTANIIAVKSSSIAGSVIADLDSGAVFGAQVDAYDANGELAASTTSAADGSFLLDGLFAGDYTLYANGDSAGLQSEWYDNAADQGSANSVTLADEESITLSTVVSLAELPMAAITGTVRNASGESVSGVEVSLYAIYDEWSVIRTAITDANGNYRLRAVDAGSYYVYAATSGDFVGRWYGDSAQAYDSTTVEVTDVTDVTGVDINLALGGVITGTLLLNDPELGPIAADDLAGGRVEIYRQDDLWSPLQEVIPNQDGTFSFRGLDEGNYVVKYSARGNYVSQWFGRTGLDGDLLSVALASENELGTTVLELGATISGLVLANGEGAPFYQVVVYEKNSDFALSIQTDETGRYLAEGLPDGDYSISIGANWGYLSAPDVASVNDVVVGEAYEVADIELAPESTISGYVTLDRDADTTLPNDEESLPYCDIYAVDAAGSEVNWSVQFDSATGYFELHSLPAGTYGIRLNCEGYGNYYYGDTRNFDEAKTVTVGVADYSEENNIRLSDGGSISGVVLGDPSVNPDPEEPIIDVADPAGRAGVTVTAFDSRGEYAGEGWTDETGAYTILNLPAGKYTLFVHDQLDFEQGGWYKSTSTAFGLSATAAGAKTVDVVEFEITEVFDVVLSDRGLIEGTVLFNGSPLVGFECYVSVQNSRGDEVSSSFSSFEDGTYQSGLLAAGIYKVQVVECRDFEGTTLTSALSTFYQTSNAVNGRDVVVIGGATTESIDIKLGRSATVFGMVLRNDQIDEFGEPLTDAETGDEIHIQSGMALLINAFTNKTVASVDIQNGEYAFTGVAPGQYKVMFFGWSSTDSFLNFYYGQKSTLAAATTITVLAGQQKELATQTAAAGIKLTGSIKDESGEPIPNSFACIFGTSSQDYQGCAETNEFGEYQFLTLKAGSYRVQFLEQSGDFDSEWYNNKSTFETSTAVEVADLDGDYVADVDGIDAELGYGSGFSGQVLMTDPMQGNVGAYPAIAIYDSNGDEVYTQAWVNGSGYFTVKGLKPGNYTVKFYDERVMYGQPREFIDAWYQVPGATTAKSTITVTAGETTNIGLTLLKKASYFSGAVGTVKDKLTGDPIVGAKVCLVKGTSTYECDTTTNYGTFQIVTPTNRTGSGYAVKVTAPSSTFKSTNWGGTKKVQSASATFTLYAGQKAGWFNVPLARAVTTTEFTKVGTPTISGTLKSGSKLTASTGSWDSGAKFKYQWIRTGECYDDYCLDNVNIKGATSKTYTLTTADIGSKINVVITASKSGKLTTTATSNNRIETVWGAAPIVGSASITGNTWVTATLKANEGTWDSGTTFYYIWWSDANGEPEVVWEGTKAEGGNLYEIPEDAQGANIWVEVGGSNAKLGNTGAVDSAEFYYTEASAVTSVLYLDTAPTVETLAGISGTAKVTKTLTGSNATYSENFSEDFENEVDVAYKWLRCNAAVAEASTDAPLASAKCVAISGATKKTYKLGSKDKKKFVVFVETATSEFGTLVSYSASTTKVG